MKKLATIVIGAFAVAVNCCVYSPSAAADPACPDPNNPAAVKQAEQPFFQRYNRGDPQAAIDWASFLSACATGANYAPGPRILDPVQRPDLVSPTAPPVPAEAPGPCSEGRCVIYLSKDQTRDFAKNTVPGDYLVELMGAGKGNPVLVGALFTLAVGHQAIANQYADRGWCSKFTASIYPWENQGYEGYPCDS